MTFENIKKRIASNIGYVDSSGDILTDKDITETDIGNWVNDRYLDDLVAALATQYPEDYEKVATADFYKTTSTIASLSGTTLTIDDAVFNNSMVGDRVYNSTQGSYVEVDSYTSTTVVEIASAQSTWAATDTVYVLGTEFAIGSEADDLRMLRDVAVKYDTTDSFYKTCRYRDQNALKKTGNEKYSETYPVWYHTTAGVSSTPTTTIGILPEPTENVADGLRVRYVELPAAMSADADVPRLPLGNHSLLVVGGTVEALRKQRRVDESDRWEQRFQVGKQSLLSEYALTRQAEIPRMKPTRKLREMLDHSR